MKRLFSQLGLFVLVGVIFFSLIYQGNQILFRSEPYLLDGKIKTLATGASRTANAVFPDILPNSANIAEPQFPYVAHYHILKEILFHNPQIDTYLIGFTPTHTSGALDYLFAAPPGTVKNLFEMVYPVMQRRDYAEYLVHPKKFLKSMMRYQIVPNWTYIKNKFRQQNEKEFPYIGGPIKEEGSNQSEQIAEERINLHFYKPNGDMFDVSELDLRYLDSIADFTKSAGVRMILFRAPVHEYYQSRIPQKFLDAYEEKKEILLNNYDHTLYLDYQNMDWPDSLFLDTDHLNVEGGNVLSRMLIEQLEKI